MTLTINRDDKRGHIMIRQGDGTDKCFLGVHVGPVLHFGPPCGAINITPDEAREVADALTWWADRADQCEEAGEPERDQTEALAEAVMSLW